jgi:hypothetical protein
MGYRHQGRMPVLVLPKLFVALFAAGVSTALPCEGAPCVAETVPRLLPVVPWLSALLVFGPAEPPVPLIVCPFERTLPAAPPGPVAAVPLEAELPADADRTSLPLKCSATPRNPRHRLTGTLNLKVSVN